MRGGWFTPYAIGCIVGAAVATVVLLAGSPAHAAPARRGRSVAACEAAVARSFRWMLEPAPADLQVDPSYHDNPQGDYRFMVWAAQKQRCHHIDLGLERPMDRVVEVQVRGTITVQREP